MNKKKVLSTAVASALVAAQMAMPVMAADGDTLDVDVTTKTAVIRVAVPTTMAIAVDQFMMNDAGTQIYSTEFAMSNKSAVDVKVQIDSTVNLGTSTKLVSTKAGAADSTEAGEAWLGVAAKSAASGNNAYDDPKSDTSDAAATPPAADVPETLATLTEANANVATFVQGTGADAAKGTASQTFYLEKGDGSVAYKLLNTNETAPEEYAQFYELTAQTLTVGSEQGALDTLLANGDVYVAPGAAADGQSLTLVEKGDSHTYAGSEVYYTPAPAAIKRSAIDASKLYAYGGTAGSATSGNGDAAFRYIGILSGAQDSWSETDIERVSIKYDIVGVTADKYAEVASDCTYGLYYDSTSPAVTGPQIVVGTDGVITFSNLDGTLFDHADIDVQGDKTYRISSTTGTWSWTSDNADTVKTFTLGSNWYPTWVAGKTIKVVATLKDGSTIESASVTFP